MRTALLLVAAGVVLALAGGRLTWATVEATADIEGLGRAQVAEATVTGDDLAPVSALTLFTLLVALGIVVTRGRGRWPVGLALAVLGVLLVGVTMNAFSGVEAAALEHAHLDLFGSLPGDDRGVTAAATASTSPAGALLATAGGLLLAAAGAETIRRGPTWPALGEAFRAPPDRAPETAPPGHRAPDGEEPPWQGD